MSSEYVRRSLEAYAFDKDLIGHHMVFIAGPRQVGKTLLARRLLEEKGCNSLYFNWLLGGHLGRCRALFCFESCPDNLCGSFSLF